jgi:hypothetical protein
MKRNFFLNIFKHLKSIKNWNSHIFKSLNLILNLILNLNSTPAFQTITSEIVLEIGGGVGKIGGGV